MYPTHTFTMSAVNSLTQIAILFRMISNSRNKPLRPVQNFNDIHYGIEHHRLLRIVSRTIHAYCNRILSIRRTVHKGKLNKKKKKTAENK